MSLSAKTNTQHRGVTTMNIIQQDEAKINTWATHKRLNCLISKHFSIAALAFPALRGRAERMKNCSSKIIYEMEDGAFKYKGASLCRDRLCPICAWRLSIKRTGEMIETVKKIAEKHPKTKAIHVVLTIKNCQLGQLREVISQISSGFTRLKKRQLWRDYILGYMRSIEITYNAESDTYHPHIHCIAIVPDYYTRQISVGDWADMWRDSARLNYNPLIWATQAYKSKPSVDIEHEVYDLERTSGGDGAAAAAIVEATKYAVKPQNIGAMAANGDIGELAFAIQGFRMVSFGGIVKTIRKELGYTQKDEPAEQLPEVVINPKEGIDRYYLVYEWCANLRSYRPQIINTNSKERAIK